ncbi:hypothetical protein BJ878DRAFT_522917 [Calycina marina]|uniref:Uncharacterized protein n=1 Tax=Calycina marina TaxID=1763456 RepID=A0A9P8CBW4_9HELO|nr:hypothetical protein BJ878DRAFT_522917 [Calycina marina]
MKWLRKQNYDYRPELSRTSTGTHFDKESGQMYNETTMTIQKRSDRGWDRCGKLVVGPSYRAIEDYGVYLKKRQSRKDAGDLGQYRHYMDSVKNCKVRSQVGARSLQDAAIECILKNVADITLEGIECLPVQIVRRVWHAVNRRCTQSFNTWSIFATVLRRESEIQTLELLRFHQDFGEPASPLPIYTTPIISNTFDFLTSLSITTAFPVPSLYELSSLKNLGILELVNASKEVTIEVGDRLVRAWHLAAKDEGAFPVLRLLRLWNYQEVTHHSLPYLNNFPALAIFDVRGCGFRADAESRACKIGWETVRNDGVLGWLDRKCAAKVNKMRGDMGNPALKMTQILPLFDPSGVTRIPRAEVPVFLTGLGTSMKNVLGKTEDAKPPSPRSPERKKSKFFVKRVDDWYFPDAEQADVDQGPRNSTAKQRSRRGAPETWDWSSTTSFARIGDLRDDSDLARAGVNIGDAAAVGDELVNSVPMVSLCLGSREPFLYPSNLGLLFFARINVPEPMPEVVEVEKPDMGLEMARKGRVKRSGHSVMNSKKRNLDDLLSSFM